VVRADADRVPGSCGIGGHGWARPTPPVPRLSSGPGSALSARALPCRCLRRTSCGRGLRGGVSSSETRCRWRPHLPLRRLRRAGRPRAGSRVSGRVPGSRRCLCCPSRVHLGGAVARRRSSCRSIRRWTRSPSPTRRPDDLYLPGRGLHGFAGGSTAIPTSRRRPPATPVRPRPRLASRGPAPSASRVLVPFRVPFLFRVPSPEPDPCWRARRGSAHAAPPVRARGHGWLVHPRGRSVAGRSGGARSQPAPSARLRSLDPFVTPFARSEGTIRIQG
jgi:hypothetical protein